MYISARAYWLPLLSLLAAGLALAQADDATYEGEDLYSDAEQRGEWAAQLIIENQAPGDPKINFHRFGHLTALAGKFPIDEQNPDSIFGWLREHRDMLGIPAEADLEIMQSFSKQVFDGENTVSKGTVHIIEIRIEGIPFSGQALAVITSSSGAYIKGLFNGFAPPLRGFKPLRAISESEAWSIAEVALGKGYTPKAAIATWFDLDWALHRIPSAKSHHWKLEAVDSAGDIRQIIVSSQTGTTVHDNGTKFHFSIPQVHRGYTSGGLQYWNSSYPSLTCEAQTPPTCTEPALGESYVSRDIFPKTVDLMYRLSDRSDPIGATWPVFSGKISSDQPVSPHSTIGVVVAHPEGGAGDICSIAGAYVGPCYNQNHYHFAAGAIAGDTVGHEYGHRALSQLKWMIHTDNSQSRHFTEAMCDVLGFIVEDHLLQEAGSPLRTDFKIMANYSFGIDWPAEDPANWSSPPPYCRSDPRRFLGGALHSSWNALISNLYPRDQGFKLWWTDILKSVAILPDFPDASDFYSSTIARLEWEAAGQCCEDEVTASIVLALEYAYQGSFCEP